jgi:hypothetical protein
MRWPRIQKIYDLVERPWTEALDAAAYLQVARTALGYKFGSRGSPNSIESIWNRSASTVCMDVVSSPEKSTISPLRPPAGYVKPSPLSPVKTVSLSIMDLSREPRSASIALQSMLSSASVALSSLPPLHFSNTPNHHDKSPRQRPSELVNGKRRFWKAPKCLHAKQVKRRGGLAKALSTGLRRKVPRLLPTLSPISSES